MKMENFISSRGYLWILFGWFNTLRRSQQGKTGELIIIPFVNRFSANGTSTKWYGIRVRKRICWVKYGYGYGIFSKNGVRNKFGYGQFLNFIIRRRYGYGIVFGDLVRVRVRVRIKFDFQLRVRNPYPYPPFEVWAIHILRTKIRDFDAPVMNKKTP